MTGWLSLDDLFYLAQAHAELHGPEHVVHGFIDDDTNARHLWCRAVGCGWVQDWHPRTNVEVSK